MACDRASMISTNALAYEYGSDAGAVSVRD